ncbi:hypothetical protein GCM10017784_35780 [Deinococcus indicus]|nr:hypothetical protein GCM10017784_35780 [Deinococcus indicus]
MPARPATSDGDVGRRNNPSSPVSCRKARAARTSVTRIDSVCLSVMPAVAPAESPGS